MGGAGMGYSGAVERRGFLKTGFAGLAMGGVACGTNSAREAAPSMSDAELERTMRHLDRALAGMRDTPNDWYLRPEVGASMSAEQVRRAAMDGELLRSSLRSMLVTSTVSELPEATRKDPRVVRRLQDIAHEADFAALGTAAKLQALTPEDLRGFDEELRRNPDFIAEVVDAIDAEAQAHGVSKSRRRHLKAMARHLAMELRRDSAETVVERALRQAQRVMVRHTTMERQIEFLPAGTPESRRFVALTDQAVALYDQNPAPDPMAPPVSEAPAPMIAPPPEAPPPPITVFDECACHPSDFHCVNINRCHRPFTMYKDRMVVREDALRNRRNGGIMLGVGIALIIPGAVFAAFTWGLTGFAVTAGIILLIMGIVWMVRGKRQLEAMYGTT